MPEELRERSVATDPEVARRSLHEFVKQSWSVIEPGVPFVDGWHIEAICLHLQAVSGYDRYGNRLPFEQWIRRLIINISPRSSKTTLTSVCWPAWEWITSPWMQFMNISYSEDLVFASAVARRRLIESDWYQKSWGPKSPWGRANPDQTYSLRKEEYAISRYSNTKNGICMATTMDGQNTGFGGNRICLTADTPIMTDSGEMAIGEIVDSKLPVRILGSSGRWQEINAYEKNQGSELLEITLDDGRSVACTFNHPIFIEGHGFIPASDVIQLISDGDIYMRRLRSGVQPGSGACGTSPPAILLEGMFREGATGREEPSVQPGQADAALRPMPEFVSCSAEQPAKVLLSALHGGPYGGTGHNRLPYLQEAVSQAPQQEPVLLSGMQEYCAPLQGSRPSQWALQDRPLGDPIRGGVREFVHQSDKDARQLAVRPLLLDGEDGRASHRWHENQPCAYEFSDALPKLPSHGSHQNRNQRKLDETVRIRAIRCRPAPDAVYNLNVSPDHDYYANGILVHNCLDDPNNVRRSESETVRNQTNLTFDSVLPTRLNNPKRDAMVIIQQRTHENDVSGHALAQGGWQHLAIPMEYDESDLVEVD